MREKFTPAPNTDLMRYDELTACRAFAAHAELAREACHEAHRPPSPTPAPARIAEPAPEPQPAPAAPSRHRHLHLPRRFSH
jgi:hypothetical protein